MEKGRVLRKLVKMILLMTGLFVCTLRGNIVEAGTDNVIIEHTVYDNRVIPDKYNTGAKGPLSVIQVGQKVGNIQFVAGNNATANVLDFVYRNTDVSGTVFFENMDFSQNTFTIYNSDKVERAIRLVFKNCKFSTVSFAKEDCLISSEFEDCTINSFYGGNASFNRCRFGGSYTDGVVPFLNVQVNNCFFSDMTSVIASGKEIHTDGTQIYGIEGVDVTNVSFNNCRFEMPNIRKPGSTAYVNACIMLQMEYSNANGISFTNCIVNGGSYSVYAWSAKEEYTLQNIRFYNIMFGCASRYGKVYPKLSPVVVMEEMTDTASLYIGSVWKENGATHFSVSNDTNQERTLLIYTDKGVFERKIAACPLASQFDSAMTYDQMPFDIDVTIPEDCKYAVCYDVTVEGFAEQIRYVNWSGETVYLSQDLKDKLFSSQEKEILSGKCGGEIEYVLTNAGVLTLSGKGATEAYHSGKLAPWSSYSSQIKEIRIEEGIERLGNQIFRNCSAVRKVTLPEGLLSIGARSFEGCSSLEEVTLPGTLQIVGEVALPVVIQKVYYNGADWSQVEVGKNNEAWSSKVICMVTPTPTPKPSATPTPKPSATVTPKPSATMTPKPSATVMPKPSATPTPKPGATATPISSVTPTPVLSVTRIPEPVWRPTASPTPIFVLWPTATPAPIIEWVPGGMPLSSPTPVPSEDPISSGTPKPSEEPTTGATTIPSEEPMPSVTSAPSATQKPSATPRPSATTKPRVTSTPSATPKLTPETAPTATLAPFVTNDVNASVLSESEKIQKKSEAFINEIIDKQAREKTLAKVQLIIVVISVIAVIVLVVVTKKKTK